MRNAPDAAARVDVSVIIPCFRCAPTIARAIDSVLAQSVAAREVVLVIDGEDAKTCEALRGYHGLIDSGWLRVVTLGRNEGAANARNAGWDAANGRYIAFLDADDAWHPRKLSVQIPFMESRPDIGLCGHRHVQVESSDYEPAEHHQQGYRQISFKDLLLANRFVTPSVVIKREITQRFEKDRRHMEDHLLWLEVAAAGIGVARLDAALCAIFKPPYGASGLSADLRAMQRGELENFRTLHERRRLSFLTWRLLQIYSLAKFLRRCLLLALRTQGRVQGDRTGVGQ